MLQLVDFSYVSKALDKMISSVDATEALDENEVADTVPLPFHMFIIMAY